MSFLLYSTVSLLILMCVILILLVLIQKGRGGGLASAFGGGGGNTAFGSKTGDVLTWATSVVFGIFLVLAIVTNLTANAVHHKRTAPLPAAPAAAATPAAENPLEGSAPVAPGTPAPLSEEPATPVAPSTQGTP